MAEETRSVELGIDNKKALKALEELRKGQEKLAKSAAKGETSFEDAAKSINKLKKQETDLLKVNRLLDKSFGDGTQAISKQEQATRDLNAELERLDETKSRTAQQVGLAGDVGSQGRTLGGAVGAFGGETGAKIEAAVSALAEIPDSLEALPLLKDSLKGIPAIATKVADSLGTSTIALGGLAVGTIALGVALAVGKKAAQESREALEGLLAAEKLRAEITHEGQQLTNEELDLKIAEVSAQRELAEAEDNRNRALVEGLDAAPLFIRGVGELSSAIGIGSQAFAVADDAATASSAALQDLKREETLLMQVRDAGGNEAAELAAQEEDLTAKRDAAIASSEAASAAFEQATERVNSSLTSRSQAQADAAEFAALEAEFAAKDQEKQETEHRSNLDDIASEGRAGIEELTAGFSKLAIDRAKSLEGVDTKGNDKLGKLRGDFFGKQIAKTEDFQRETSKIETDTAKKRTKLLEDLRARLVDSARDNNVIAFLEAQRDGNKKLADDAISATDAEAQRVQEFARNREQERQVFLEKEAETLAGIEKEKQAVIASFAEKQVALSAQIAAEKVAIEDRIKSEQTRFAEQEAREAEQAARQAARDEIRNRLEQRDFDARMTALQEEQNLKRQINRDELAALQAIQTQIAQLQAAASTPPPSSGGGARQTNSRQQTGGGGGGGLLGAFSQAGSRFGQRRPNSDNIFHEGGKIDFKGGNKEGYAYVEQGEGIISKADLATQSSQGLPLSLAGNSGGASSNKINVTVQDNRTVQVGDIATASMVSQAMKESNTALMVTLNDAFEGMIA